MNIFVTGWIMIGLGGMAALLTLLGSRSNGAPFAEPRVIGGLTGVIGLVMIGVGVILVVGSTVAFLL